jgi:hypothetical protein
MAGSPEIVLESPRALVDDVVGVRIPGLAPDTEVELRARTSDEEGTAWSSRALFRCDGSGTVDLAATAPVAGSWKGADPMAFIWSMALEPDAPRQRYVQTELAPARVTLEASAGGAAVARAEIERVFVAPDVERTDVREQGLVATLYQPADPGGRAAVLVIGGSAGGLENARAAALANRGHTALSLAYFGIDPNRNTGEEREVELFVATFGASSFTYAEATETQRWT